MPTTSSSRHLRRAGAVAAALSAVVLSAGCSLLPGAHAAPVADSSAAPSDSASAAASPAPPVATPVEPADYGTRSVGDDGGLQVTLTGVHRITDAMALVSMSITATTDQSSLGRYWSDPSLSDTGDMKKDIANFDTMSGITLTVQGDPSVYTSVTDGDDHCLCSQAPGYLDAGTVTSGWAYVSLPADATAVNVTVAKLEPWIGVPVS